MSDSQSYEPSHYTVLNLSQPNSTNAAPTAQNIKSAYRASLLKHHPDKTQPSPATTLPHTPIYSVDEITRAYTVLSSPSLRDEYDRSLRLLSQSTPTGNNSSRLRESFKTGIEIVDLDDMDYDDGTEIWYRSCRCGDDKGFTVNETDLNEAAKDGEIGVGCRGCSLWLKVQFGVLEDDETQDFKS